MLTIQILHTLRPLEMPINEKSYNKTASKKLLINQYAMFPLVLFLNLDPFENLIKIPKTSTKLEP